MIKVIKKILKKIFKYIGILIVLIILSGLVFRIFSPEPHKPKGKIVNVNGIDLHIQATGIKRNKPTVIIESGASSSTEYYHWLSEGMKDSLRVIRYDRAGNGYSELSDVHEVQRQLLKNCTNYLK